MRGLQLPKHDLEDLATETRVANAGCLVTILRDRRFFTWPLMQTFQQDKMARWDWPARTMAGYTKMLYWKTSWYD